MGFVAFLTSCLESRTRHDRTSGTQKLSRLSLFRFIYFSYCVWVGDGAWADRLFGYLAIFYLPKRQLTVPAVFVNCMLDTVRSELSFVYLQPGLSYLARDLGRFKKTQQLERIWYEIHDRKPGTSFLSNPNWMVYTMPITLLIRGMEGSLMWLSIASLLTRRANNYSSKVLGLDKVPWHDLNSLQDGSGF